MMRKYEKNVHNLRINILMGLYLIGLVLFAWRLFSIQILKHGEYTAIAQDQYWNLSVIPAQRGDIISEDNYVLAGTQTYYILYIEPKKVANPHEVSHILADSLTDIYLRGSEEEERLKEQDKVYKLYYDKILKNLSSNLYWAVVERNLTPEDKLELESKGILGIGFEEEPIRYYPEGGLAAHVLGFVAYNGQGEKQGYFGIEGFLDGDLRGKSGRVLEERDALGNPILVGGYKKSEPIKGRDIVLTINRSLQYVVEKKLKEGVEKYDAKSGTVLVMDPFSGEVIAMANYPSYLPGVYELEDDIRDELHRKEYERTNLCISQTYEPGSVMKPFTISSAVELGKVTQNTTFEDRGPVQYSDYVIDNWDGKHHGVQTIAQLLEKSNNIGAAWVGHLVGSKELSNYLNGFGLGKKTEIELEGEDTGQIRDYTSWTDIDLATISFGQGISATALQVLNAFNVIANGGFLVQPKIVSRIIDHSSVIDIPSRNVKRVISKNTSDSMVEMLESAAASGEAKYFVIKNYRIAGKTGTAQIPVEGKYDPEKTNATFAGFLAKDKQFTMIVKLEEPRTSIYAAETAVPLWMDIATELIKFYGIPPDKEI